jgi:hypothetical protein
MASKVSLDPFILEYFCDYRDLNRRTALAIVRGLLYQLLDTDNSLYKDILPEFERNENLFSDIEKLWRIINGIVRKFPRQIYFILDGLDECDSRSIDFLQTKLKELYSASNAEGSRNIKTIIVSRRLPKIIKNALRIDLDLEHSQEREEDLKAFILPASRLSPKYPKMTSGRHNSNVFCLNGQMEHFSG